jgi:hypothetical protein
MMGGSIIHLARVIEDDLAERDTGLSKPQRIGLADLAASVITCRNVNTSELATVLPRDVKSDEERYRYINRWLANDKINCDAVLEGFIPELVQLLHQAGQIVVLSMDQSQVSKEFECLMVSLRVGERAIPVSWRVIKTKGEIGFDIQKILLQAVFDKMPTSVKIVLMADRFYGTPALISLCQKFKWHYRIRLKGNLTLFHQGGELRSGELIPLGQTALCDVALSNSGVKINIGAIQEQGKPEPWIIAMDCMPTEYKVLDYGMRWSIEPMFSDFKSRGFDITTTQLQHVERIERLILVLSVAYYWAVSTGMQPDLERAKRSKKKRRAACSPSSKRASASC